MDSGAHVLHDAWMSFVSDKFHAGLGRSDAPALSGVRFDSTEQRFWESVNEEIDAGFYIDGFVYLFGEGLEPLLAALPAWSFLAPAPPHPMIVGYNAFGTLLVVKDRTSWNPRLGVLDPARVVWWDPADLDFSG